VSTDPVAAATVAGAEPRRRLHPLSPPAKLWGLVPILLFLLLQNGGDAQEGLAWAGPGRVVGALVLLIGVSLAVGYLFWSRTWFWFDADGDFRLASGIVNTRERRVQVSRLQAVDIVRPLAARLLGLAELRIDVAGGSDSKVRLAYLSQTDAAQLRADLLARSAGVVHDRATGPVPEAPEATLVKVPTDQLVRSILLRVGTILVTVAGVALVVVLVVTGEVGPLLTFVIVLAGLVSVAVRDFMTHFDFTLAESPDGLRTRAGLLETRAQTVPPGRVQGVALTQPPLWRGQSWVRVTVTVAGYSGGAEKEQARATVLLPVVPESLAVQVLNRVLPGFDPTVVPLTAIPRRAHWCAPLQRSLCRAGLGESAVVSRYGRFTRVTAVVPYARVQSVRLVQGPVQRRLRLATVHVDTTDGPVSLVAAHRDEREARAWVEELTARALAARAGDTAAAWMRQHPGAPTPPPTATP
jgi:putative membrane protein